MEKKARRMARRIKGEPECPKCGSSIDHLEWIACRNSGNGADGRLNLDYDKIYYYCLICDALLFDNEGDALEFVR